MTEPAPSCCTPPAHRPPGAHESQESTGRPRGPEPTSGHGYTPRKDAYQRRLKRIEGQVRGIQRMIDEDVYCIDVVTQISAATSALENVAVALMEDHLHHCVKNAIDRSDGSGDEKINEAMRAIKRMIKS
ncbi:metal-sensitive transcriptional regulator [Corynebacterium atypicum]|uniref:metal-sensitive transcriptional regulator n=1 Tax=Corynebacterium atypicum TaxID=191610 RepID=UPI0009FFB40A|nr:metal-sensitive transcriptional regulator [Corynebacterium atypicum]